MSFLQKTGFAFICPLLLLTVQNALLKYNSIGLFEPPVLLSTFILLLVGLAIGYSMAFCNHLTRVAFLAVLVSSVTLSQFPIVPGTASLPTGKMLFATGIAVIVFMVFWPIRRHLTYLLTIASTVLYLGSFFVVPASRLSEINHHSPRVTLDSTLPAYFHVVLDQHIGVEGIPVFLESREALVSEILTPYLDNGFRVFGRAYSHYRATFNSLPSIFNFETFERSDAFFRDGNLLRNQLFQRLAEQGDIINTLESPLSLCRDSELIAFGKCWKYPFLMFPMSVTEQAKITQQAVTVVRHVLRRLRLIQAYQVLQSKTQKWPLRVASIPPL